MILRTLKRTRLAWLVLVSGIILTVLATIKVKHLIEDDVRLSFAAESDRIALRIEERLHAYALILHGGEGLFAASVEVTAEEWKAYTETLRASGSVPGIQGIGFAAVLGRWLNPGFSSAPRSDTLPDEHRPARIEPDLKSSIRYLEPQDARNRRAIGYDMFSEPVRRAAMEQARDTGEAALSGKVVLVQETGEDIQAGTLMYVPVYQNGARTSTVSDRRAALVGWVYSPYRMNDLMTGILGPQGGTGIVPRDIQIYDGEAQNRDALLYDSHPDHEPDRASLYYQRRVVDFNGRKWLIVLSSLHGNSPYIYFPVWATLVIGLTLSLAVFWLAIVTIARANALSVAERLTDRLRQSEQLLRESEFRWKFAIEGSGDAVWDLLLPENKIYHSDNFGKIFGYGAGRVVDDFDQLMKLILPEQREAAIGKFHAYLSGQIPKYDDEFQVLCPDGVTKWILNRGMIVERHPDGSARRVIGTCVDITTRKGLENQVRELAFFDPLTRLPNRRLFEDRLRSAMEAGNRSGMFGAVMFIDLDNFKPLNDTYGHAVGDMLLVEVAERITGCLRAIDTVARIGGDEFVVIVGDLTCDESSSIANARLIAEKIRVQIAVPYRLQIEQQGDRTAVTHLCSASVGLAIFHGNDVGQSLLLIHADEAMYAAKDAGGNCVRVYGQDAHS
jgi:diguanylate cyclase (GGDEF)-like protein/PAS domain S-box-containing protein